MKVERDYEEFLELLNVHDVKYCIVGAFALAFHARPRYTKDLDIFINPTPDNASKVIRVLKEFGFEDINLTEKDFEKEDQVIQLGYEPVRIDLLTSITGCTFNEVWENKVVSKYGSTRVNFIGKRELIKNKRSSGRKQDLADLDVIEE
jgi:hypothetical protein